MNRGTGIPACPCSRRRSSSSPGTPPKKGIHRRPRRTTDPIVRQRNPPPVQPHHRPNTAHDRPCRALVHLATTQPNTRTHQSLPQTQTSQPVVAVLADHVAEARAWQDLAYEPEVPDELD